MEVPRGDSRRRLTRQRVLQGGVELADAHGLASVTMRRLGEALGVEGMALYKHVANKDDLLTGMLDIALNEVAPPVPGGDWKAELRRAAVSTFATLLRHPWACELRMTRGGDAGAGQLQQTNAILGTLREGGFSVELTHHAFHVIDIYVYGSAFGTVTFPIPEADLAAFAEAFIQQLPRGEYPYLVEHITYHIETGVLSEGDFEFGLDLLLDSLERLLPGRSTQSG